MGKFCSRCGAPGKETDVFCGKCGMELVSRSVADTDPARCRPARKPNLRSAANLLMQYVHFLLIGVLIFTLVLGILNFTAGYNVKVTTVVKYSAETQREKQSMPISQIFEVKEYAGFTIASLVYGVFNCVLAGFGGYGVFLRYVGYRRMRKLVKNYSLTGLTGNLVYLLLVWILGVHKEEYGGITMKAVISPHLTLWLSLLLFGLLLMTAMFSRSRRRRR